MTDRDINVVNKVGIKDRSGYPVGFQGTDHYDASSMYSDTIDLPSPGYIYIGAAGTINLMLIGSTIALPYTFETPGLYPIMVRRIFATNTNISTAYIVM